MANKILNDLLKEYERKRVRAEIEVDVKKENVYKEIPRLEQIEQELSSYAIKTAKELLNTNKNNIEKLNKYVEKLKKEKEDILKLYKIDKSILEPQYECKECKDTGYIQNQDYTTQMCHCLKQKLLDKAYNKSNISNLDRENFEKFNINIFSEEKDEKYNSSPRENMLFIERKCKEFIKEFDNPQYKNLLFTGNIGLRKNIYVKLYSKRIAKKRKSCIVSNCSCIT